MESFRFLQFILSPKKRSMDMKRAGDNVHLIFDPRKKIKSTDFDLAALEKATCKILDAEECCLFDHSPSLYKIHPHTQKNTDTCRRFSI